MYVARNFSESLRPGRTGAPVIFVHTPKCGGRYVGAAFARYRDKKCITQTEPSLAGHLGYTAYRDGLAALGHQIDAYTIVGLIRNPFAWQVSWFSYIKAPRGGRRSGYPVEHELFQKFSFADYVDWLDDPDAVRSDRFEMGRPLSHWVCDESGQIAVDWLLRQEHLALDLDQMRDQMGLRIKLPAKKRNVSNSQDFRSFYTAREVDRIAARHADDLTKFDYRFE